MLIGLFDGHGGSVVSNYLQKYMPETMKEHFKKHKNNPPEAFEKAFTQIDAKISGSLVKSQ